MSVNVETLRLPFKRRKVIYKRDYNRAMEEVNRVRVLSCTLENVELLDTVRLSMVKTKTDLDEVFLGLLETIGVGENSEEDAKLEDEWLKERDMYLLNLDRAIGACISYRKKFEGGVRRDSLLASPSGAAGVTQASSSMSRLPKVGVPTFDGNIRNFLDFKALFENIVHNDDTVVPVRKMHYLKESLVGEASKTLANISVSDEGYQEAWGRVLAKYDNKRIIVHAHFNDLFNAEKIRSENQLRQLLDQVDVALRGLRACGELTDRWSSILAYVLYVRLDQKTRADFDNSVVTNTTYYNFKDMWKFCEIRAGNVEARKLEDVGTSTSRTNVQERRSFLTAKPPCVVCQQGAHLLIDCAVFISKTPAERLKAIQQNKLCVNCFSKAHTGPTCPSFKSCKICFQRHHYMLHLGDVPTTFGAASSNVIVEHQTRETESASLASSVNRMHGAIILPSATVRIQSGRAAGEARVLLDNCSQPTLISDTLVKKLRIRTYKNEYGKPIRGVGFETVEAPRSCKLTLLSRVTNFVIEVEAEVIAASAIPYVLEHIARTEANHALVSKYALADTAFYTKNPRIERVDIILGAQYVEQCFLNETRRIQSVIMRKTHFGWTLNGEFPNAAVANRSASHVCCLTVGEIEKQVTEFLESKPSKVKQKVEMNQFCENHFVENTYRDSDGKFVVRLPFLKDPKLLGSNRRRATAILNHSRRNEELDCGYNKFMTEYLNLGHMTAVLPDRMCQTNDYLIPHHAVVRPDSTTTRIRVVFNASSVADSGYSLNSLLAVGPQLQPELFDALIRFRKYDIAFTADIAMMYRCIWVHPEDRRYQRVLWRPSPVDPIQTFELNTVTYGTAPAPFLAVRCLFALAQSIRETDRVAAQAIEEHFYMDDLMTGAESVSEAKSLREKIHHTLAAAGLQLRKYQSNSPELLQTIPNELWMRKGDEAVAEMRNAAILGIDWQCQSDTFGIRCAKSSILNNDRITKRQLLSEIAKVFDPLGFLAPVTIRAKLLVQRAWSEGVQWDEAVSPELTEEVKRYLADITQLNQFQVARTYQCRGSTMMELIGFCSATESRQSSRPAHNQSQ